MAEGRVSATAIYNCSPHIPGYGVPRQRGARGNTPQWQGGSALFVDAAAAERPENPDSVSAQILIPAFMVSELKTAFQMGFLLFIPFLILDMVVASVLVSMGMMMLPPTAISLPFKILFFVLIDGWNLMVGSLIRSFI